MTGHWRYFWSSVALPTVLFYSAILESSHDVDPKWLSVPIHKLVEPFLNALIAVLLLETTAIFAAVLYLTFSLIACVFALNHFLRYSKSSRKAVKRGRESWYRSIRRASFVWHGLREYGKALLYSSATVAMLFCCILVAEHVLVGLTEANSTTTQSIIAQWNENSPIFGEEYAAMGRGEKTDRYQSTGKIQLFNLQPFQRQLGLCSLVLAAFYIILAMGTTYWSSLSSDAVAEPPNLTS